MASSSSFLSSLLFLLITILHSFPFKSDAAVTQLVNNVCKQTPNYNFCVQSLYADHRTPDADAYTLAYVSVGLAYVNATTTRDYISKLLNENDLSKPLQTCLSDYKKAISVLETAYNDLNSETFFELSAYANRAGRFADDCENGFNGYKLRPLGSANKDLIGLCGIFAVVGKLFTGES